MNYTHRARDGVATPLRIAYLLLTSGRPMSGREIADEVGLKSASNVIRVIDDMELAGFVTKVTKQKYKGRYGYKYYYSAELKA